jgi:oxygen-dependent protoporphyrinogen oxidase
MSDVLRLVIVGGGITGLSAARAALAQGREKGREVSITVLERAPRFGGKMVTERVDGYLLDGGPDSWVVTKPQATALVKALGLGGTVIGTNEANRRYYVAWDDQLHPVPEGLVLGVPTQIGPLLRTHLFTWRGKARMGLEPFIPARQLGEDGDESIADFATRRLGREAAERLVAPLLGGVSGGDANDISVRASFPQLLQMEREHGSLVRGMRAARRERLKAQAQASQGGGKGMTGSAFVSLEGGVGELPRVMAERLAADGVSLRSGVGVDAVVKSSGGYLVRLSTGATLEADKVLLAVPGYAAAELVKPLDGDAAGVLSKIEYGSTATVFLGYRRDAIGHPLAGVGFVVPRAARRPALAGTWVSSKWDHRAPPDHVLLRVFLGGAWAQSVLKGSDGDLVTVARGELRTLMGVDAEPDMTRVFRFDRSAAQMKVGHLAAMHGLHEKLAQRLPGLLVAGGGYDGVGIPDCIRQGEDAGRQMVA